MATQVHSREFYPQTSASSEAQSSGVSWSAVVAGAFSTSALSLILLALGTGIGLSAISPWSDGGDSASRVGLVAILWLVLVQIVASAVGGYLAGRLRTKWVSIHTHEVYFRDTAHGFLVWAVGLVITAVFFASAMTSMAGGTARNSATIAGESAVGVGNEYFVDSLFRTDHPAATSRIDPSIRAEASLVLVNAIRQPNMPAADKTYLTQLVSATTGLNQADADRRVDETVSADRQAVDDTRKALAHSLYWLFVALLIGAFCASYAATIGGRQRDRVSTIDA
jgi:hypothetical protein